MKTFSISLVSRICILLALAWPHASRAQVPTVFQTTFNIPPWTQGGGSDPAPSGDGIAHALDSFPAGFPDQIIAAANYPGGGGGLGYRHYRGNGSNVNGGGLIISFSPAVTEVWVRFYMLYSLGFGFTGSGPIYTKDHYWNQGGNYLIFGIQGNHAWGITDISSPNHNGNLSWSGSQGGITGDGLWHLYEYHVKLDNPNSILEIWIDNVRVLNATGLTLGSSPLSWFELGSNQADVTNCNPVCYTDYDDIAISTSGRIGPIGTVLPAAPRNLRVQ